MKQSRRSFLSRSARTFSLATIGAQIASQSILAVERSNSAMMLLGFSTYGAKTLSTEKALRLIKKTGYDSVEITVWPGWDAAPENMPGTRRSAIRNQIDETGLKLTSLMEHLYPESDENKHKASLERLKAVYQLANDLSPDNPPVVQTVLGGGNWEQKKTLFVDRVGDWTALGKSHGVVMCVKPHRGGGMSRPSEAVWLIEQIGEPDWLKMVYDYSHYAFRDIPLKDSIKRSLPHIGHVAVKDAVQTTGKNGAKQRVEFRLPGEAGTIDFVTILRTLHAGGYTGDISCEVSGMVSGKNGYDPLAAMNTSYANISKAFQDAGIDRA